MAGFDWPTVVALVTALAGIVIAISTRRKNEGEAALALSTAAEKLIKPLNARIQKLDESNAALQFTVEQQTLQLRQAGEEISELRERVIAMSKGIDLLVAQIESLGQKPVWSKPQKGKK